MMSCMEVEISRECITCDAEHCDKTNPKSCCVRCRTVYYCGRECQKRHWPMHKLECRDVETMKQMVADIGSGAAAPAEDENKQDILSKQYCCGICLEEKDYMTNPVVLPCRHVFCYPCLRRYQQLQRSVERWNHSPPTQHHSRCPYCRSEIYDVKKSIVEGVLIHAARAGRKDLHENERNEYAALALQELEKIISTEENDIQARLTKAEILGQIGDHTRAIELFEDLEKEFQVMVDDKKKVDELTHQAKNASDAGNDAEAEKVMDQIELIITPGKSVVSESELIGMRIFIAEEYVALEKWDDAISSFGSVMMRGQEALTAVQQRRIIMGLSRCFYEKGKYDTAIDFGHSAIETNRHFPGVHKYVALSYKSKGDLREAQKVMTRAVLYETPWDEYHKKEVRTLFEENMQGALHGSEK